MKVIVYPYKKLVKSRGSEKKEFVYEARIFFQQPPGSNTFIPAATAVGNSNSPIEGMIEILRCYLEAALERTENSSITIAKRKPNLRLLYDSRSFLESKKEDLTELEYGKFDSLAHYINSKL